MKPETKEWLETVVPLLAHLKEGGFVRYKDDGKLYLNIAIPYFCLLTRADLYTIHVEPRVIYVSDQGNGKLGYHTSIPAVGYKMARFVEDLNWKPDKAALDADHHLPDHMPPHMKPGKAVEDYMKTV